MGAIALVESCTYHGFSGIKGANDDKTVWKPGKKSGLHFFYMKNTHPFLTVSGKFNLD